MSKIQDWRQDPAVAEAREQYQIAAAKAESLESDITTVLGEIRSIEAERATLEAEIINGKAAPSQLIDRKVNQASKRAHLETLEDQAASIYKGLAAARDRLNDAEAKAKAVAWQAGMQEYVQAADELEKTLEASVAAEAKVSTIYRALGEQFEQASGWIIGPGENVGNACYNHRRLQPDALANWKHWRAEAGIISPNAKRKRAVERLAEETRRLVARQSKEEAERERAAEYWKRNAPQSTRDLSPGGLVRVTMFPGSGEGVQ